MPPQGFMEHGVQVVQAWQMILGNCLTAANLMDFLVEAILIDVQRNWRLQLSPKEYHIRFST
jgi:hypothetical protein